MLIKRLTTTLAERAEMEHARAQIAQNEANIEYIAMMADVDLEETEVTEDVEEV